MKRIITHIKITWEIIKAVFTFPIRETIIHYDYDTMKVWTEKK